MRPLVIVLAALALVAPPAQAKKPVVLVLHGGSFIYGSGLEDGTAQWFRDRGVAAEFVHYRTDRPSNGLRDARRAMNRQVDAGRRVYVFGISSGGTFALRLAQTGKPQAVAAVAPVVDLRRWTSTDPAVMAALTPEQRERVTPQGRCSPGVSRTLIVHGTADEVVAPGPGRRYAATRRCNSRHVALVGYTHFYIRWEPALEWLLAKATRARPARDALRDALVAIAAP